MAVCGIQTDIAVSLALHIRADIAFGGGTEVGSLVARRTRCIIRTFKTRGDSGVAEDASILTLVLGGHEFISCSSIVEIGTSLAVVDWLTCYFGALA